MNFESQAFPETEYSSVVGFATQTPPFATLSRVSVSSLSTMLEQLWMFYEAMRFGKPVADTDLQLASLKTAMRSVIRRA